MRLVVGLGNPGPQYVGTRHNIGFEVIDHLAQRLRCQAPQSFKNAEIFRARLFDHDVFLSKPQTFMNRSGDAVGAFLRYYKGEPSDVIVVHDELDFAPGDVRLKPGGGAGGHNGLKSITDHIGRDYARVRMGIGKPPSAQGGVDYVLARFDKASRVRMDEAIVVAADAVQCIVEVGMAAAMNRLNRRPQ